MPPPPRPRLLALLAALLLLAAAPAAEARHHAPWAPPGEIGPFGVGHEILELVDASRGDRPLPTEVWYPADPGAIGTPTFYDFHFLGLGLLSEVAQDGVPASRSGRFPLVVFSHGSGGVSWQSTFLMEALASHGFVVAAPNHTGNTAYDFLAGTAAPFEQVALDRPRDVSFVIDELLARSADPLDPLFQEIRANRIGVAGHSFGGYTALVAAGGFAAIDVAPDPRVRAVAPIAPASSFLADDDLAAIDVPMFLLSGTLDTTTPIEPNTERPWELAESRPLYRADVRGARHEHFAAVCDIGNALAMVGISESFIEGIVTGFLETCRPPALDAEEVKRIQSTYLVAFFERELSGDGRDSLWLSEFWAKRHEPLVDFQVLPPRGRGRGKR